MVLGRHAVVDARRLGESCCGSQPAALQGPPNIGQGGFCAVREPPLALSPPAGPQVRRTRRHPAVPPNRTAAARPQPTPGPGTHRSTGVKRDRRSRRFPPGEVPPPNPSAHSGGGSRETTRNRGHYHPPPGPRPPPPAP